MVKKKDTPPLTKEETIELLDKAMRKPGLKPHELVNLQATKSKLLEEQTTPSLSSNQMLWKPEDLCSEDREKTVREVFEHWANDYEGRYKITVEEAESSVPCLECIKATNAIIQAPGFWTIGPDGNRWGPIMRKQGRYIGPVNDMPVGEWEELREVDFPVPPGCTCFKFTPLAAPTLPCDGDVAQADALRHSLNLTEPVNPVEQPDDGLSSDVKEAMERHRREEQDRDDDPDIIL